jgi:PAS domain S-box-containing protein
MAPDPETGDEVERLRQQLAQLQDQNAALIGLLDAIADHLVLGSIEGELLYANAAARRELASRGIHDPIGRNVRELGFPDHLIAENEAFLARLLQHGDTVTRELVLPMADGGRWVEDRASPVRRADGTIAAVALVSRDIHARKLAEEYRERMIGVLGHDLRNPLAAISGLSQLTLRSEILPAALRPRINQIEKSAARALEMIASLLAFSEGRFRGFALAAASADVGELCRAVVDETAAVRAGRIVDLAIEGDCVAACDTARLGQAVTNLLANALVYGAVDRPVRLAVAGIEGEITITVTNHGPTIPASLLPVLFEPFRRGPAAEDRAHGLGLGLYIVREIVQAHGGSIEVTSDDDTGTCFRVRLPRQDSSS